ncbi:unnamed protein product [Rotaria sp. Silwood1]|nr:unnamed protein product [Rotaria sp. Silwood1]CAF3408049.1 unnamed protein product [Rotaria sp. Silwood1]CAF3414314.1 unnamed protein product [Rotaria sp. Silwood1]CAF4622218.1 unnamed protein product [Rotaria sp. Silwood1]CAF4644675.1 unnamed protein product [Rotaria sp. Silwood1]
MKIIACLLLFILLVKYIESINPNRTYVLVSNGRINQNGFYGFDIFDSKEKTSLYRLRVSSSDIDIAILVDYPAKNIMANLEGIWIEWKVNVTFSVYDCKLNKWTDGIITKYTCFLSYYYTVEYNNKQFIAKWKSLSSTVRLYSKNQDELLAEWRPRTLPLLSNRVKYDLKIYSDKLPDAIYFFLLLVMNQRDLGDD